MRVEPHSPGICQSPDASTTELSRESLAEVARERVSAAGGGQAAVLYVTHNGLTEPLGRRQVLPYLTALSEMGWKFTVISFEKPETADPEAVMAVQDLLSPVGIRWLPLSYHRRPAVIATAYDALRGWMTALTAQRRVGLLHARSTVPAAIVRWAKPVVNLPWVFDVRGLLAEEYADAGHWRRGGVLHRLTNNVESRLMTEADGLVFLTQHISDRLRDNRAVPPDQPSQVIPCCVDTEVFRPSAGARGGIRRELGLGDAPVMVYAGSLGSWYCLDEMLDFHGVARQHLPGLRLMILTPQVDLALRAVGMRSEMAASIAVQRVAVDRVPVYLAAADAGLCFLRDSYSKTASSPTKYGEYLASGLPVVTTGWTGDAGKLATERAWITIDAFCNDEYERAAARLTTLLARPKVTAAEARRLGCREFSLGTGASRYDALYREVLARWRKAS